MLRTVIPAAILFGTLQIASGQSSAYLDVNDIRMRMYSNGSIGMPGFGSSVSSFEVPQGEGTSPLYSAGTWFSGVTSAGETRVAAFMSMVGAGMDFFPGPLRNDGSATADPTVSAQFDEVWVVYREEIITHLAYFACVNDPGCDLAVEYPNGYTAPASILAWPAMNSALDHDTYVAPFFDRNGDGIYDPAMGDAPCILGDQAMFLVYNDMLEPHGTAVGAGLGLEVQVMPFAFTNASPALEQVVFFRYRVINRSTITYSDAFFGYFNDFDIGCSNNDLIATDPSRSLFMGFHSSDVDHDCLGEVGYGVSPPAFGMTFLKGALVDADGADSPIGDLLPAWNGTGFGDGIEDNERHGLSRSMYFNREGSWNMTYPTTALEFKGYMDSKWKDGVSLTYGGTGYSNASDAIPAYFIYPGSNDPLGAGTNGIPQPSWAQAAPTPVSPERRGVMSMGPFTLGSGEHLDLLIAYVYARSNNGALASLTALQARTDSVIAFAQTLPIWDMADDASWSFQCEDYLNVAIAERQQRATLALYPSPTQDDFHFDAPTSMAGAQLVLYDVTGREVLRKGVVAGLNRVDLQSAPQGVYLCVVASAKGRYFGRVVKE